VKYRLRNFPHFPANKILIVAPDAQCTERYVFRPGHNSPAGRHEKLPTALAGRRTDIRSHLCRGGHEISAYLATGSRMPIPTPIFPTVNHLRSYCRGRTRDTHAGEDKRKDFQFIDIKGGLIIFIIRKKSDFNTLKNRISRC
jgi:hypothetical protein